jgi:hypothetical protein
MANRCSGGRAKRCDAVVNRIQVQEASDKSQQLVVSNCSCIDLDPLLLWEPTGLTDLLLV